MRVRVDRPEGAVEAEMHRASPYFRAKGARHDVTSLMDVPVSFLEIELK